VVCVYSSTTLVEFSTYILHNWRADRILAYKAYREHAHFLSGTDLVEEPQVEGIVVVAKVQHASLYLVGFYPVESGSSICHTSRHGLV